MLGERLRRLDLGMGVVMVIVQLSGGLGNQMFEYALYLALKAQGKEVTIDDESCYGGADTRPIQLSVFGLSYDRPAREELIRMTDSSKAFFKRVRRKLFGRRSLAYREATLDYDPQVLERDPAVLEGCFQSERYFADIRGQVREAFRFRAVEDGRMPLDEGHKAYLAEMKGCESVAVHVRRGDYLDEKHNGMYLGICAEDYYERAFRYLREELRQPRFFIFSNDIPWVKEHLSGEDRVVVEGGTENTGYQDLYLMSRCRHAIIANSSFSWWGAWLIENQGKMVIAPKVWLNGVACKDIYTEDMIRI